MCKKNDIKVLDLFCGCGGFSLGFIMEGFDVLGIDIWDIALKSHNHNVLNFDIGKLKQKDLPSDFQKPTIIIGSPPCQKFSTVNQDTRTKDDTLIKHFRRIVDLLQPKLWIWENVMGSRCVEKGEILDAQNFGVAQRRKRNFVANFNVSSDLMRQYYKSRINIIDVLDCDGYTGLLDGFNSTIYSLNDVAPTIRRIPLKWYDGRKISNKNRMFNKKDKNGKTTKVGKQCMSFAGYPILTIQDHLILMGFPKNYKLYGGTTDQMIQVGNAVSPAVSVAIAKRIKNELSI